MTICWDCREVPGRLHLESTTVIDCWNIDYRRIRVDWIQAALSGCGGFEVMVAISKGQYLRLHDR